MRTHGVSEPLFAVLYGRARDEGVTTKRGYNTKVQGRQMLHSQSVLVEMHISVPVRVNLLTLGWCTPIYYRLSHPLQSWS